MKADAGVAVPAGATLGASVPRTRSVMSSLHAVRGDSPVMTTSPTPHVHGTPAHRVSDTYKIRLARCPAANFLRRNGTAYLVGRTRIFRVAGRIGEVAFSCGFPNRKSSPPEHRVKAVNNHVPGFPAARAPRVTNEGTLTARRLPTCHCPSDVFPSYRAAKLRCGCRTPGCSRRNNPSNVPASSTAAAYAATAGDLAPDRTSVSDLLNLPSTQPKQRETGRRRGWPEAGSLPAFAG